ncbi:ABC transporter substrate-binding protein [Cryptosporangium aurantiacum]|uniref:Carbohydrate ABC transporter substrate-binding protein, CUT1 family n=1 Tax=Cryptosporangium aurantiacum TaxID=134849 RepID=A0A1M7PCZ4_9ACTN|nr:extracellular solute-binding protein [Cryptosporangium aurantiacum]SHN14812.1 carbohydrate ABC transporter substrate-binding protein, CUT1 family [Cryptosporangium aurantiacum]
MKRFARAVAVATAVGLALAACSANNDSANDSGVAADGTATVKAKELTVWTSTADQPYVRNAYKRFEKKFGVKLSLVEIPADGLENQVQTKWASGDRPDLLEYHATSLFWALNPAKNLVEMSDMPYVERSGEIYESAGSLNGKIYAALTVGPGMFGMYYNRTVLADAGLTAPKTFADLEKICTTVKRKAPGVTPIYEAGGSQWPTQIQILMYLAGTEKGENYSQDLLAKKATLDDPEGPFVAALTEYKKLQGMGCFNRDATTAKSEPSFQILADGKAAILPQNTSSLPSLTEVYGGDTAKASDAIGWASPSATTTTSAWSPSFNGTWYVPKTGDADRQSTALAFIQWITTDGYQEYLTETKRFPALSGAKAAEPVGIEKDFATAYDGDKALAVNASLVGFGAQFPTLMTGLLSGQNTPAEVGELAQKALEQGAKSAQLAGW